MLANSLSLNCPICHKEYESPVLLPCGESVCSKCVNPVGPFSNNFLCKLCNSMHQIPDNNFPPNKALIKVIESNRESVSEKQVEKSLKCFLEIEAGWDFLKKSFENSKENIKDSVRQIINDIELVADLKCSQINQIRDDLVEKVLNYERDCFENYTNYGIEYYKFVKELEPYQKNKESYVKDNFLEAQTIKSRLGIEIQKFKNRISNFEIFSFKQNPAPIDPRSIGFIYEHHVDPIRLSEFMKIDFSSQLEDSSELRRNLKIKKLNEQFFVISYILTSYGIDITTNCNSIIFRLVLQIHDFSSCHRRFELELSENQLEYEIEANEGVIVLYITNLLISLYYNLKEIARTNVTSPVQSMVIFKNLVFCLCRSKFGSTLQSYNFALNSEERRTSFYLPENTDSFFVNENFFFFKNLNQILVVDKDDGSFVKNIEIDQSFQIFRVNNENVIAVLNKALKTINFLDLDGKQRDERSLDQTLNEKTEIILNDNYSIELIDCQNLAVYI